MTNAHDVTLPILLAIPLIGSLVIFALKEAQAKLAKQLALLISLVVLVYTAVVGFSFDTSPGVSEVVFAKDEIKALLQTTRQRQVAYFGVAVVLIFGAVLLIFNAIQLAVFSRRREIEVMKLVGATNWFIRLPFMLEGMLQGVVGAAVAAILVYGFRSGIVNVISDPALTQGLRKISASPAEARNTGLVLMAVGAAIGATSSALAVRRHIKV